MVSSTSILTAEDLQLFNTLGFVPSVIVKGRWTLMRDGLCMAVVEREPSGEWLLSYWLNPAPGYAVSAEGRRRAPFKSDTVGPLLTWAHVEGLI